jgi:hypothetical protein
VEVSGKSLPVLTNLDKGKYGVIVFENLNKYLQMDKWNRELLDKYCREYSVGIVGFNPPSEETLVGAQLRGFPLFIHTNLRLKVSLSGHLSVCTCVILCWKPSAANFTNLAPHNVMLCLGLYILLTFLLVICCMWGQHSRSSVFFHDKICLSLSVFKFGQKLVYSCWNFVGIRNERNRGKALVWKIEKFMRG